MVGASIGTANSRVWEVLINSLEIGFFVFFHFPHANEICYTIDEASLRPSHFIFRGGAHVIKNLRYNIKG